MTVIRGNNGTAIISNNGTVIIDNNDVIAEGIIGNNTTINSNLLQ